jgi:hypothetical protein
MLVTDAGAPVTAGPGCTSLDAHTADCRTPPPEPPGAPFPLNADVRLGDGDDLAEVAVGDFEADGRFDLWGDEGNDRLLIPSYLYFGGDLRGGPGNDVLHGFGNSHLLDGGPGADEIVGGSGYDTLRDGDPDDAPALDTIDGGGGRGVDTLDYTARADPVRVDLGAGRGGEPGEGDRLAGVEDVVTGRGDDVVLGSPHANNLDGGAGTNFIAGRRGGDTIKVQAGGRALGGDGNDRFDVRGFAEISCGRGREDLVIEIVPPRSLGPELARDCERLGNDPSTTDTPTGLYVDPAVRRRGRQVRLTVDCGDCDRGRLRVTTPYRPVRALATQAFRLATREETSDFAGNVTVTLPPDIANGLRARRVRFVLLARGLTVLARYRTIWTVRIPS